MRLVHLEVERFQCIQKAELELGPGLNVLYGPNDLGKSSLAWAIRAVLLLQHNSVVHERFVSWCGDGEPRVALTIADDDERLWRVTKTFGGGSAGRSRLESSRDRRTFTTEATGREVHSGYSVGAVFHQAHSFRC
jgi:predicted ATP-dependent endonuclease of OLD family